MFQYQAPSGLLNNRVILITGASQGLGRAIAKGFASFGATVILMARSIPKLETVYDEIIKNNYPTPAIYPLNLANANPSHYDELKEKIESNWGRLDGIVHAAAHLGSLTPIEYTTSLQWYEVMQVNVNSTFLMTKALLPLLKKSEEASVIFTADEVGSQARAYWGAYAASKFALNGFMQVLADELQTNTSIKVNSVYPGKMRTALRMKHYPAADPADLLEPQSLLPIFLYLMGPESKQVTGQLFENKERKLSSSSLLSSLN